MSGEQAAVSAVLAAHDGFTYYGGEGWKCRCRKVISTASPGAAGRAHIAHQAAAILEALATATPARLSDEERADIWDEAAEATAEWMASNPGPSGIGSDPPCNPYEDAARAVQPTPPDDHPAECGGPEWCVPCGNTAKSFRTEVSESVPVGPFCVTCGQVWPTPPKDLRAALAPTAADQVAAMKDVAKHGAQVAAEGRRE